MCEPKQLSCEKSQEPREQKLGFDWLFSLLTCHSLGKSPPLRLKLSDTRLAGRGGCSVTNNCSSDPH